MNNISSGNKNVIDAVSINQSILRVIKEGIDFNCYSSPKGIRNLRIKIADFIESNSQYKPNYEDMLITSGSQQSINLIADSLLNEGDTILIEQPTYYGALEVFKRKKCKIVGINIFEGGIDIKKIKRSIIKYHPKLIYVVPTFNNPTGIAWSLDNRLAFLDLINKYNLLVIEDDPYFLINYTNNKYESLYKLNKGHNVIYLGTFSKLISSSINVGYIITNKNYINILYQYKESYDLCTSLFNQYVILDYLKNNDLNKLIKKKIPQYKRMLNHTLTYLNDKYHNKIEYTIPKGGLFIFIKFDNDNDIDNILFNNNQLYFVNQNHNKGMRINICNDLYKSNY